MVKLDATTRSLLEQIASALGLDMSATIRLIIREKAWDLSIQVPTENGPAAKKKRSAAR